MRNKVESLKRYYEKVVDDYKTDIAVLRVDRERADDGSKWDYDEEIKINKDRIWVFEKFITDLEGILK